MALTKCKKCDSGWEIKDDENYCGWCGARKVAFEVTPDKNNPELIYNDSKNEITLRYKIKNLSSKNITVKLEHKYNIVN